MAGLDAPLVCALSQQIHITHNLWRTGLIRLGAASPPGSPTSNWAASSLGGLQPKWPLLLCSLPLPHASYTSMYLEVLHYSNHDGIIHASGVKVCVSSKNSKCISVIKRILSTTAMYISSYSFMYLCISFCCDACSKPSALRVGVKTFLNTIETVQPIKGPNTWGIQCLELLHAKGPSCYPQAPKSRKVSRSGFYFPVVYTPCWVSQILVVQFLHLLHVRTPNPLDLVKSTNRCDP